MSLLTVMIGSTRPGRAGLPIAHWFTDLARTVGDFDVEVADLAEIALPMFAEPHHPRLRRYEMESTRAWSALVERTDAFVIVTPEYNYGYPAPIKNALDTVFTEWAYAPVGFVSYGGVAAGTRAVQQLKQVVTTLRMVPVFESVNIPFHAQHLQDGTFTAPDIVEQGATEMLRELRRVETAVHDLRDQARTGP